MPKQGGLLALHPAKITSSEKNPRGKNVIRTESFHFVSASELRLPQVWFLSSVIIPTICYLLTGLRRAHRPLHIFNTIVHRLWETLPTSWLGGQKTFLRRLEADCEGGICWRSVDLIPILKYIPERWVPWKTICRKAREHIPVDVNAYEDVCTRLHWYCYRLVWNKLTGSCFCTSPIFLFDHTKERSKGRAKVYNSCFFEIRIVPTRGRKANACRRETRPIVVFDGSEYHITTLWCAPLSIHVHCALYPFTNYFTIRFSPFIIKDLLLLLFGLNKRNWGSPLDDSLMVILQYHISSRKLCKTFLTLSF